MDRSIASPVTGDSDHEEDDLAPDCLRPAGPVSRGGPPDRRRRAGRSVPVSLRERLPAARAVPGGRASPGEAPGRAATEDASPPSTTCMPAATRASIYRLDVLAQRMTSAAETRRLSLRARRARGGGDPELFLPPDAFIFDRDGVGRYRGGCEPEKVKSIVTALPQEEPDAAKTDFAQLPEAGSLAPSFEAATLDGKTVALDDLRGKKASCWSSACRNCPFSKKAMACVPRIMADFEKHGASVAVVNAGRDAGAIRSFYERTTFGVPVVVGIAIATSARSSTACRRCRLRHRRLRQGCAQDVLQRGVRARGPRRRARPLEGGAQGALRERRVTDSTSGNRATPSKLYNDAFSIGRRRRSTRAARSSTTSLTRTATSSAGPRAPSATAIPRSCTGWCTSATSTPRATSSCRNAPSTWATWHPAQVGHLRRRPPRRGRGRGDRRHARAPRGARNQRDRPGAPVRLRVAQPDRDRAPVRVYWLVYDGPVVAHPDEIDEARFWTRDEIEARLGTGAFTPFEHGWQRFIEWEGVLQNETLGRPSDQELAECPRT